MEQEYFKLDFTVINIGNYYLHPQLNMVLFFTGTRNVNNRKHYYVRMDA